MVGAAGILAHPGDERPADGHVGLEHLACEGREDPAALDEEGRTLEAEGNSAALFALAHTML